MKLDLDRPIPEEHDGPDALDFDRLLAGDLPDDEARALEAHAADDAESGALLARLRAESPGVDDPVRTLAAIRRGLDAPPTGLKAWFDRLTAGWWTAGLVAAGAAAAVAVFALRPATPEPPAAPDTLRTKGAVQLHVLRKVGEAAARVSDGARIRPADALRFQVTLDAPGRVKVVGVEPDGTLYTAWPLDAGAETRLPAGKQQPLPGAVHLEGPSGPEQLYLVHCPEDVADACASAGAGQTPACADACRLDRFDFVRP